jgi:hypothetical protein
LLVFASLILNLEGLTLYNSFVTYITPEIVRGIGGVVVGSEMGIGLIWVSWLAGWLAVHSVNEWMIVN